MFGLGNRRNGRKKRPYVPPAIVAELPLAQFEHPAPARRAGLGGEACDPIDYARSRMPAGPWMHCAYLGLDMEPDVVELWPSKMHSCFANGLTDEDGQPQGQTVSCEDQVVVCMNPDQQRLCPHFLRGLMRGAAEERRRWPEPVAVTVTTLGPS